MTRRDRVFISYRRADAAGWAGRLHDRLAARLGADRVFVDVASLRPGTRFADAIDDALASSGAVVAVIGPEWTTSRAPDGTPRLDQEEDFVALEVQRALEAGVPVFPVLVDGASPPTAAEMPDRLAGLASRQAIALRPDSFDHDVQRLVTAIEDVLQHPSDANSRTRPRWVLAAVATVVAVTAVVGVLATRGGDVPAPSDVVASGDPTDPTEVGAGSGAEEGGTATEEETTDEPSLSGAAPSPAAPLLERAPNPGDSFQYMLSEVDLSVEADVYDIDWEETTAEDVAILHDRGTHVVCYVSAGTWESFRPDAGQYPEVILGEPLEDFADERWIDIRRLDVLLPLVAARLEVCTEKGFDSVEFDNVDGNLSETGFELTEDDQLQLLRALHDLAREHGLSPGLKNSLELVPELVDLYDWLLMEECIGFEECDAARPFADAGKAVFAVEYELDQETVCNHPVTEFATVILKSYDLDAPVTRCEA